jgi:predicted AAA+ superfamily ATPase
MRVSRTLINTVRELVVQYPILAVTGPRQSGKTTLVRETFPDRPYVSLEDLDERAFANEDPRGFLDRFPDGAVFDEVQQAPGLFSYLQTRVDQDGRMGLFVLTGSHRFGLLTGISQSLAGRAATVSLLPFSLGELKGASLAPADLNELLLRGLYPPVHDRDLEASTWYGNYIRTYVERDVRQLLNIRDLGSFQRFVALCAGRTGQLLNLSALAGDAGVSHTTARGWISVLEAGYLIHLVRPHHRNFNKRLVKTPTLYFVDTGLACRLLRIETPSQLDTHPLRGALFQTWVASELLKSRIHQGLDSNLHFWRDRSGHEIDLLIGPDEALVPIEVKSGSTIPSDARKVIRWWTDLAGDSAGTGMVVYGGDESFTRAGVRHVGWRSLPEAL